MPEVDSYDDFDGYVVAEILMHQNGEVMRVVKIIEQSTNNEENPIGYYDRNSMLNTRVYYHLYIYKY